MGSQGAYHELPDGTVLPRVTSILEAISKPRLIGWAARKEREHVVRVATELAAAWPSSKPLASGAFHDALQVGLASFAHELLVDEANEIGSAVHRRIEWSLRRELGQQVETRPPLDRIEAMHAYRSFKAWRARTHFRPIHIEERVYSLRHGYAGTMDVFGEMELPEYGQLRAVLDWKSSKRIYGEAGLQNAAYGEALIEMGHAAQPLFGVVLRLPKAGDQTEAEMKVYPPDTHAERFETFLSAFRVWRWQQEQEKAFKPVVLPEPQRPATPVGDEFAFG